MQTPKELKLNRQYLLKHKTPSELSFKRGLDNYLAKIAPKSAKHLTYNEQQIIGFFIADFCFPTKLLVIEIDGEYHNQRISYDIKRDAFLAECGFTVLRIKNGDVDNFDFTIIDNYPNFQYNKFKRCQGKAASLKGRAFQRFKFVLS